MFRAVRAPYEVPYGASLSEFGYHMNQRGNFVDSKTGEHFNFFHTDSERANDGRRGAFQECLRTEVAATLKDKHGIEQLFLSGEDGATCSNTRPTEPHVAILVTELSKLRKKREVIVVVGESTQDCGMWAWRLVQREGGTEEGSLVGLARKIAIRADNEVHAASDFVEENTPGIIVLNPGQLLYSPGMNKSMTMASWRSRRRPTAISEPYVISKKHNFVPGHKDSTEHVYTVLQLVLPQLIVETTRLHIITVGDGSVPTIEVLDRTFRRQSTMPCIGGLPESIALIEPRHEHDTIVGRSSKTFLAAVGKSWVQSEELKGTKLQFLDGPLPGMLALEFAPVDEASDVNSRVEKVDSASRDDLSEASTIIADSPKLEALQISKDSSKDIMHEKENIDPSAINSPPPMEVPPNTPINSPPAFALSPTDEKIDQENVVEVKATAVDELYEDDPPPLPPAPVSCPTFSAGVCDGVVETVFPAAMDDVLEHLWFYIKQARESDAATAAKGKAWPRDGGDH